MNQIKQIFLSLILALIPVLSFAESDIDVFEKAKEFHKNEDYGSVLMLILPLVERDYPNAINLLGIMYDDGNGVELNDHRAVELFSRAHTLGYLAATVNLGLMYEWGEGVKIDYMRAKELYLTAHEKHFPGGTFHLAEIFYYGIGIEPNQKKALNLFQALPFESCLKGMILLMSCFA